MEKQGFHIELVTCNYSGRPEEHLHASMNGVIRFSWIPGRGWRLFAHCSRFDARRLPA